MASPLGTVYPAILQFSTVPITAPVDIGQATLDDLPKTDTIKLSIYPSLTAALIIEKIDKYIAAKFPGRCLQRPTELVYYVPLASDYGGERSDEEDMTLPISIDLTSKLLEVPLIAARTVDAHVAPRGNKRDHLIVTSDNPIVLILRRHMSISEQDCGLMGDILAPTIMDEINNQEIMQADPVLFADKLVNESVAEIQDSKTNVASMRVHWSERLPSKPTHALLDDTLKEEEEALESHLKILQEKAIKLRGSVSAKLEAIEATKATRMKIEKDLDKREVDGEVAGLNGAEILQKRDQLNKEVNELREEITVQKAREKERSKREVGRIIAERSHEVMSLLAKYTVCTSASLPRDGEGVRNRSSPSSSPIAGDDWNRNPHHYQPHATRSASPRSLSKILGENPVQGHPRLPSDLVNSNNAIGYSSRQGDNWRDIYEPQDRRNGTSKQQSTYNVLSQPQYGVTTQAPSPPPATTTAANTVTENTWLSPTLKKQVDKAISSALPVPGYLANPQYRASNGSSHVVPTPAGLQELYSTYPRGVQEPSQGQPTTQSERYSARSPLRSRYTYDTVAAPPTTLASDLASYLARLEGKNTDSGSAPTSGLTDRRQGLIDKLNMRQIAQVQPFYPQPTDYYIAGDTARMAGEAIINKTGTNMSADSGRRDLRSSIL